MRRRNDESVSCAGARAKPTRAARQRTQNTEGTAVAHARHRARGYNAPPSPGMPAVVAGREEYSRAVWDPALVTGRVPPYADDVRDGGLGVCDMSSLPNGVGPARPDAAVLL